MQAISPGAKDRLFVGRETAAKLLDVSTRTIDDAIREGKLPASRVGRRVLIRLDALIRYAEHAPKAAAVHLDSTEPSARG